MARHAALTTDAHDLADVTADDVLAPPSRFEVRWFVPGPLPRDVRLWASGVKRPARVDRYFAGDDQAIKARNVRVTGLRFEAKTMLEATDRIEVAPGVSGVIQHWTTRTTVSSAPDAESVDIRKRRWSRGDLEVVELEVGTRKFWSVSLKGRTAIDVTRLESFPRLPIMDAAISCSYPEFLFAS